MSSGYEIVKITEDFPAEAQYRATTFIAYAPRGKRVVNSDIRQTSFTAGSEPGPSYRNLGGGEIVGDGEAVRFNVEVQGPQWKPRDLRLHGRAWRHESLYLDAVLRRRLRVAVRAASGWRVPPSPPAGRRM